MARCTIKPRAPKPILSLIVMCKDDADDETPKTSSSSAPKRRTIDSFLLSDYSATATDEIVPMMHQASRCCCCSRGYFLSFGLTWGRAGAKQHEKGETTEAEAAGQYHHWQSYHPRGSAYAAASQDRLWQWWCVNRFALTRGG